jgi:hypothetical protein
MAVIVVVVEIDKEGEPGRSTDLDEREWARDKS